MLSFFLIKVIRIFPPSSHSICGVVGSLSRSSWMLSWRIFTIFEQLSFSFACSLLCKNLIFKDFNSEKQLQIKKSIIQLDTLPTSGVNIMHFLQDLHYKKQHLLCASNRIVSASKGMFSCTLMIAAVQCDTYQ